MKYLSRNIQKRCYIKSKYRRSKKLNSLKMQKLVYKARKK